jgi:hypothetical protein
MAPLSTPQPAQDALAMSEAMAPADKILVNDMSGILPIGPESAGRGPLVCGDRITIFAIACNTISASPESEQEIS